MKKNPTLCFIGAGHMARSIILGLCADGYPPESIWATNTSEAKLNQLKQQAGINTTQNNSEGVAQADVIILAVKPDILPDVLREIQPTWLGHQPLIISVAAGFKERAIRAHLAPEAHVIRCMPNTPCLVGSGATGLHAGTHVAQNEQDIAETIMRSVSIVQWLDAEQKLDKLTALSGSGSGYVFYLMDAIAEHAAKMGLSTDYIHLFTAQTFLGAARMALETDQSFEALKNAVCSKGGTTEQALALFDDNALKAIIGQGMDRVYERAQAIGDSLSQINHDDEDN